MAEQFWAPTLQMYTHAPAEFTARSVWALKAAGQGSFFVSTVQAVTLLQLSNSWDTSVTLQIADFQGFLSHYLLWHLDFSYIYKIHEGKVKFLCSPFHLYAEKPCFPDQLPWAQPLQQVGGGRLPARDCFRMKRILIPALEFKKILL